MAHTVLAPAGREGPPAAELPGVRGSSLVTQLGVISGEILSHIEQRGAMPLRGLARELKRPAGLVMMGTGALIRQGLLKAIRRDAGVVLELAA